MRIAVVGTGYVGLVTGTCFAEMGNHVICVDMDAEKVRSLQNGHIPIYEPGLEELVLKNAHAQRLRFTTSLQDALTSAAVVFIAVGTPQSEDGSADLQFVLAVANQIGSLLERPLVVVDKSTVPVGTADQVHSAIADALHHRGVEIPFDVVSNPEFLKEGAAVDDFMRPDRIIIGTDSAAARALMEELYSPFMRTHNKLMFMGVRDAELTKYAANAMLATKISFINEMACLAEQVGVDIENVRLGLGADQRIGHHFIYPGCGYGGSCFPKDVKALIRTAQDHGLDPVVLQAVERRNAVQKTLLFSKVCQLLGDDLRGRRIAVWGLAFKPGTDDVREAPSLVLIRALLASGVEVYAHDPVAVDNLRKELPVHYESSGQLRFVEVLEETLDDADAMVLVTEWKQYRQPDFEEMRSRMRTPVIVDGRNQYSPERLRRAGFVYSGVGRGVSA